MTFENLKDYCLSKKASAADFPFGPQALVIKVKGKMFALIALDHEPLHISLKCNPTYAQALRQNYSAISAGYHLNKKHWNTLVLDESLSEALIKELIDHSYNLVVKGLKKADRLWLES